ncbi:hypothetical protein AVEN_164277-1 [Araneus ventricosus]|uniref:Uncharacterized protein n=1 Tax=Araneus ventricosus TaxID=182803 RepID=A0A4Y2U6T3_ARAVE|nr:hypothetical protein AVEN_79915-1 [Araneus ventricosus]GBO08333.1 hypothetical protein AVEN_164277-1 [Araneus ventricosus]
MVIFRSFRSTATTPFPSDDNANTIYDSFPLKYIYEASVIIKSKNAYWRGDEILSAAIQALLRNRCGLVAMFDLVTGESQARNHLHKIRFKC